MNNPIDAHCPYPVGSIIADKYRVEKVLGKGGMGIVVAARHIKLDEPVAVKLMLQDDLFNQHSVERFLREARACVRLKNNEHIARVSDVDTLSNGVPYMVMELLDGCDLDRLLKDHGVLSIHEACSYVVQACRALKEAHEIGIIHRDIKPQNLFLTRRRDGGTCIKVLDFGISKYALADESASIDLTRPTDVLGSLYYMSPEQARSSRKVVPQSDIYSLGAVLYKLLTGRAPFPKKAVLDAYEALFHEFPPPPAQIRRDIPPQLESIILRCLDKQVENRFQNVGELIRALTPFTIPREMPAVDDRDSDSVTTHPRANAPRAPSLHGTERLEHVIPANMGVNAGQTTNHNAANQPASGDRGAQFRTQPLDPKSLHAALHAYLPPHSKARPRAPSEPRIALHAESAEDVTARIPVRSRTNPTPARPEPTPRKQLDSVNATEARKTPPPQTPQKALTAPVLSNGTICVTSATDIIRSSVEARQTIPSTHSKGNSSIPWNSFPAAPGDTPRRRKWLAAAGGAIAVLVFLLIAKFLP
jgi:serine/threonine-protein kinase